MLLMDICTFYINNALNTERQAESLSAGQYVTSHALKVE